MTTPTTPRLESGALESVLIFAQRVAETDEPGYELSQAIQTLIERRADGLDLLQQAYASRVLPAVAFHEILSRLGHPAITALRSERLQFLAGYLDDAVAGVRSGAAHGLLDLGDTAAIEALRQAAGREPLVLLRRQLQAAITELERIHTKT